MPSLDDLKKRIKSVKSTQKITKAMKMVAAAKLRKAQESAEKIFMPIQPGDVEETFADIDLLKSWSDFEPKTSIEKGIINFAKWYTDYFDSDYYRSP